MHDETTGEMLPVVYKGIVPDIFAPGIQVVVEGRLNGSGTMEATTLLAKCPSRFTSS
jgi:cytochrome c-type biogenesis protein CcmE